jgi:hypothetical protein
MLLVSLLWRDDLRYDCSARRRGERRVAFIRARLNDARLAFRSHRVAAVHHSPAGDESQSRRSLPDRSIGGRLRHNRAAGRRFRDVSHARFVDIAAGRHRFEENGARRSETPVMGPLILAFSPPCRGACRGFPAACALIFCAISCARLAGFAESRFSRSRAVREATSRFAPRTRRRRLYPLAA